MELPLEERKEKLRSLIDGHPVLRFSESFDDGAALYDHMLEKNLEGVVAKRLTAQPEIMRLIAHVAYCIAVLEDDDKAPISKGATDEFLTIIAAWFSDDEKLQLRVLRFLYQSTENHHAYLQQVKRENEERLGYRPKGNAAG